MTDSKPADGSTQPLSRYARAVSEAGLKRALDDQARLTRGRWNASNADSRHLPAGLSESHYQALRSDRDQLDSKEWNEHTGFSGCDRWPDDPGMPEAGDDEQAADARRTARQLRRAQRRMEIDDGF